FYSRIALTLRPKERAFETQIVTIDRRLHRGHVRSHPDATRGDLISFVVAKGEKVGVRKIEPAKMSITAEAEISDLDRVRPHITDQRRSHQKTVPIKFDAASIVVVMKASLNRVALANEVLPEDVCDVDVLVTRVEGIETA